VVFKVFNLLHDRPPWVTGVMRWMIIQERMMHPDGQNSSATLPRWSERAGDNAFGLIQMIGASVEAQDVRE
jgi:hypothetical protein